jgi:AmpD protein
MIRNKLKSITNSDWHISADGWCTQASRHDSPNHNARSDPADISLLVIHNISLPAGQFGGAAITELFQNCLDCSAHKSFESLRDVKVSSHFLIRRDGALLQFVSTLARAWHAGVSSFDGRAGCNDFSIGIELEGTDDLLFEPEQYQSLGLLTQALFARFPITHIVGHDEIAPGRKTDPGPCFDWELYERGITLDKRI